MDRDKRTHEKEFWDQQKTAMNSFIDTEVNTK